MARERTNERCQVEVVFIDGVVETYVITAGIGIASFLARQAAELRQLVLWNHSEAINIPMAQIRSYTLRPLPPAEAPAEPEEKPDADQA